MFTLQICTTTPCWLRGSDEIMEACERYSWINVASWISPSWHLFNSFFLLNSWKPLLFPCHLLEAVLHQWRRTWVLAPDRWLRINCSLLVRWNAWVPVWTPRWSRLMMTTTRISPSRSGVGHGISTCHKACHVTPCSTSRHKECHVTSQDLPRHVTRLATSCHKACHVTPCSMSRHTLRNVTLQHVPNV